MLLWPDPRTPRTKWKNLRTLDPGIKMRCGCDLFNWNSVLKTDLSKFLLKNIKGLKERFSLLFELSMRDCEKE